MHSILEIKSFCVPVHIGNTGEERKRPQNIQLGIKMGFLTPPEGEKNDTLEDTICYNKICEIVRSLTIHNKFSLIEKLAGDILKELRKYLSSEVHIQVCAQKLQTPIESLKGGVSYTCGDLF